MDLKLLYALEAELPGKPCMLATIVERAGSVPRGVGVSMVVSVEGELTGTVGGGSLEFRVRQDALELLKTGELRHLGNKFLIFHRVQRILILELRHQKQHKGVFIKVSATILLADNGIELVVSLGDC